MTISVVQAAARKLLGRLEKVEAVLAVDGGNDQAMAVVISAMDECLAELAKTDLWGRANELPSSMLWNLAGPVLQRGWMQNRARTKPRGYAGDYQLLGRMVRNQLCDDPLGRLFDQYFQNLAAPIAVRNRSNLVQDWIVELVRGSSQLRQMVAVGSGPAFDVEHAIQHLTPEERERLRVRLLDYDPHALEDANARIGPLLPAGNLELESGSLFRISSRPKMAAWLDGADLIVSVGMFDYLDHSQSAQMLNTFWDRVSPGGDVAVFNFSPRNTSRAYMEWIGNWYLIYRDEAEMRQMAAAAGIPAGLVEHGSEASGVDLFLRARKPAR